MRSVSSRAATSTSAQENPLVHLCPRPRAVEPPVAHHSGGTISDQLHAAPSSGHLLSAVDTDRHATLSRYFVMVSSWQINPELEQSISSGPIRGVVHWKVSAPLPLDVAPPRPLRPLQFRLSRSIVIGDHSQHSQSHRRAAFSGPLAV
jgi:hypothetical protein